MVNNPFSGWSVSGSWLDHLSYSEGGTDYPLAYGTDLPAPGAGTLVSNGWVGSAGRRATLQLDTPAVRQIPKETGEGDGDMVAVQFQHASSFMPNGHYAAGAIVGKSGASANGLDYGGDVHLHIHGLNAAGQRVDFTKFIGGNTPSPQPEDEDMQLITVFADQGSSSASGYGSTAVISARRGFVQTSTGLGARDELNAWKAIANALGMTITERHVDTNGFEMAKRF